MPRHPSRRHRLALVSTLAASSLLVTPAPAGAELVIHINEVGGDVVVSGAGSVRTDGVFKLPANLTGMAAAGFLRPAAAELVAGPLAEVDAYGFITSSANNGQNIRSTAAEGSGDTFGFIWSFQYQSLLLILPRDYASQAPLSGRSSYRSSSFESLGLTPGTYRYDWGSGANADRAIVWIGGALPAVPGPLPLLGVISAFGASRRLRRRLDQGRRPER